MAGCLQLHAEKLFELSASHFDPDGLQANAQRARAKEMLAWSQAELTADNAGRTLIARKVTRNETDLAIEFVEDQIETLNSHMRVELELILGPLEKAQLSVRDDFPPALNELTREKAEYEMALFYLRLILRYV